METKSGADEVAVLLKQVSVPAARRDYELRSSSPAPKREVVSGTAMKKLSPSSSSSEIVSRAFQNARAMSFNAAATHSGDVDASAVPFVLHQAPNRRVFFSGPLASRASDDTVRAPAATVPRERSDSDVVAESFSRSFRHGHELSFQRNQAQLESAGYRLAGRSKSGVLDPARVQDASRSSMADIDRGPAFRRARSGELRASTSSRPHCSELPRELCRGASRLASEEQTIHARARSGKIARATEAESKKQTESRRRPTASIAWDSLNESQANSPQHELAAIPFRWEEAPGKPLGEIAIAKSTEVQDSQQQQTATTESALSRAQSHRFYARSAPQEPARKSSFDATSAARISEVASSEAQIDLVAPAAAKFLVDSHWRAPRTVAAANEANVAVPFQWEAAPGVAKHDETDGMESSTAAQLQLPPRLIAAPALSEAAQFKEEMRGRNRTRAMSGPLAGYQRHTSPSRRRQLQHSPASAPTHRSSSPSKLARSVSPSRIPQAIAHHFSRKAKDPASVQEAELQYSPGTDALARCPSKRSSSPSRIRAIAQHFTRNDRDPAPSSQISQHRSITASLEAKLRDSGAQGSSCLGPCPSKRSASPSRIHAMAQHFSGHKSKHPPGFSTQISPQSSITATLLESDLRDTIAPENHEQSPSGALSSELGSRRIHALANRLTCETTPSGSSKGQDPWSPTTSINLQDELSHLSGPTSSSSNSDMDVASQTPVDSDAAFSKSFSQASYESFEHSFVQRASSPSPSPCPEAAEQTQSHETNSGANSQPGSPYLGPTDDDFRTRKASVGAAEGVKAVVKMCTFRRSKTHGATHEMWAPTLVTYFRSLEAATMITSPARSPSRAITNTEADHGCNKKQGCSDPATEDHVNGCNHGHSCPACEVHFDACEQGFSGFSSEDPAVNAKNGFSEHSSTDPVKCSKEAATRLAYTTPNSPNYMEPNAIWKEYCESPNASESRTTCLGTVKLAASRVNSKYSAMARSSERHHAYDSGLNGANGDASVAAEDGFRSPAYAATLELLSPPAELSGRGRKKITRFKGMKLVLASERRKTQIMEAMCTSLKHALYKCARSCCRKTCSAQAPLNSAPLR